MKLEYSKKDYEISIFKNLLSNDYEEEFDEINKIEYFKQTKIATIGTNKYKSPIDACSPKFVKNINGKKTLTFNMYYKYYDYNIQDYQINPYISQINNDTLIELKIDDCYYDLLITKIQKNSENNIYQYTAEDAHIIELGKKGFNVELALELENNMGTIKELGSTILKDSDWNVHPDSEMIIQSLEDSLYKIKVDSISFTKRTNYLPDAYYIHQDCVHDYSKDGEILENATIYVFYNDIIDIEKNEIGFLYWGGDESKVVLNADGLVVNSFNYVTTDVSIRELVKPQCLSIMRGRRVVRSPKNRFDNDLKRTVTYFKKNNDTTEYYGYSETDYMTPVLVENYISNPCNMTSLYDWGYVNHGEKKVNRSKLLWQAMPRPEYAPYVSFLRMEENTEIINKGIQGHRNNIGSLAPGDTFILAFLDTTSGYTKPAIFDGDIIEDLNIGTAFEPTVLSDLEYSMAFYEYKTPNTSDIDKYNTPETFIEREKGTVLLNGVFYPCGTFSIADSLNPEHIKNYVYTEVVYSGEETYDDFAKDLGSFVGFFIKSKNQNRFYEVMFFPKKEFQGEIVWPGKIFTSDGNTDTMTPLCQKYYNIYKKIGKESVLQTRTTNLEGYSIVYDDNCEKISSIIGKEQNYYTLLSNLTKNFECWMETIIERDTNGNIIYDTVPFTTNGQPIYYNWKKIDFDDISEIPKNDTGIYIVDGKRIPIKEISYIEKFDKFDKYKEENGNYKNVPSYLIDNKYFLNYLYIVDFVGKDTLPGPNHPKKEYYILELKFSQTDQDVISVIKKPRKYVLFKNYLNDTPNWAGFKYGINVKSIDRTEDATNFSTKVIVKNNTNEFAIHGDKLCTIARAENNPTKDNFIIDFGYYIRQGLLDKEKTYEDLYNNWFKQFRKLNEENEEYINSHVHWSTALDKIKSEYETYYLAYNSAWENIYDYCAKVENCGEKYAIINKNDEGIWNFSNWNFGGLCAIKENTFLLCYVEKKEDMIHTKSSEIFAGVEFSDATDYDMEWFDLPVIYVLDNKAYRVEENILKPYPYGIYKNYYYVYMKDDEIDKAFGKDSQVLNHHTYFGWPKQKKLYHNKSDYYWNKALYGYVCRIDEDYLKQNVYKGIYERKELEIKELKKKMEENIEKSIMNVNKKKELLKIFFSKYSSFIRESSWYKEDYVDDELYYLDGRDSLHAAAFPKISYSINVIDIDEINRMEVYKLQVGDYTFIEDTEFFGWDDFKRPAKEWVVVTEASYDLEQPQNNQIKIQNYKTQIEDLFSRLSANIQQLELNKGGYNREIYDRKNSSYIEDENGIRSINYNKEHGIGWAFNKDGTYFLGNLI